ncbi:hypothetical protein PR048_008554 [Dryococelus australis]|uniref:RNA-directed DNA polymerase n=1 Tax=Dryococelus australis TaxID=614101 RepID=A0ABQ9HYD2_9NEOP|nr:hypothetical protein PR048_008554 [Dryococelus australis]
MRVRILLEGQVFILQTLHASHQGIVQTNALARSCVWWSDLDKDVEQIVQQCEICQATCHAPPKALNHPLECTKQPWTRLYVGFAGLDQGQVFFVVVG